MKAACPLCMHPFKGIIYNIRSEKDYDRHIVGELQRSSLWSLSASARAVLIPIKVYYVQHRQEREGQPQLHNATLPNQIHISRPRITTAFRLQIYLSDLWAVSHVPSSRQVSPEFYRANPDQVDRLAPWLNHELKALMQLNETRVLAT